jgi:hypothetical protein
MQTKFNFSLSLGDTSEKMLHMYSIGERPSKAAIQNAIAKQAMECTI